MEFCIGSSLSHRQMVQADYSLEYPEESAVAAYHS